METDKTVMLKKEKKNCLNSCADGQHTLHSCKFLLFPYRVRALLCVTNFEENLFWLESQLRDWMSE